MAALLPLALLLPSCAWALAAPFPFPAGSRRSSCKPIPRSMALCHGVGYTEMRLPNLLGHDSMKEALQQASSWAPLLSKNCHGDAKKFLCSLFAPVCLSELGEPVSPCRALCEEVRDGCAPVMAAFGFPWPDMFNCSRFPQGDELCVPPASPGDRPSLLKEALRMSIKALSYVDGDLKVIPELKSRTLYKQKGWSEEELRQPMLWLTDGEACTCEELRGPGGVLLAMGHRVADRLVLSWVRRWQRGDKELKRLSRAVRKLQC
ncbi:PREDICTED: secreted frizzled-related protein 2-like isoform X2 [Gavialis gangeticus]|uniref:secreted frizzled-related protein 2-like isoform X2 n=1 Tax=Gavialis gangeticus TaxID=94835 RepID=UPI00092ED737|nr:PREDICTED: secreted frizzled-related protein 2-like isoform X2 [Gavialis gangeticus]